MEQITPNLVKEFGYKSVMQVPKLEKIVLNASPLILLCNAGLSSLLPALFREIVVPDAVWREIVNESHLDQAARMLPEMDYVIRKSVHSVSDVVRWDLGPGETDVLSFAMEYRDFTFERDMVLRQSVELSSVPDLSYPNWMSSPV